jgi:hypothetical protein
MTRSLVVYVLVRYRMEEGWKRAQRSSDDYYLDGVAYTFNLDPAKLKELVVQAADCFTQVQTELLAFADLLERQASR